jgi:hypothetical protein
LLPLPSQCWWPERAGREWGGGSIVCRPTAAALQTPLASVTYHDSGSVSATRHGPAGIAGCCRIQRKDFGRTSHRCHHCHTPPRAPPLTTHHPQPTRADESTSRSGSLQEGPSESARWFQFADRSPQRLPPSRTCHPTTPHLRPGPHGDGSWSLGARRPGTLAVCAGPWCTDSSHGDQLLSASEDSTIREWATGAWAARRSWGSTPGVWR